MLTEDYVSYETAKLLKEKGFDNGDVGSRCGIYSEKDYENGRGILTKAGREVGLVYDDVDNSQLESYEYLRPTIQMAMKWLREVHNVLIIPDYDYECTDKSYCYKIYKLGENGKPERVPIVGVRYDTLGEPHTEIVSYRDYKRSYFNYKTYAEACEAGIKYCLEN